MHFKIFVRIASDFEFLSSIIGLNILKKDTAFKGTAPIQE
jgi:hypothetical protein